MAMKYLAYEAIGAQPNIIVDGSGLPSTVLVLSHWPHSNTPREFKADTSTEIVLNFLASSRRAEYEAQAEIVSNNHFDEDGLMSLWALLNPAAALNLRDRLISVATAGDFSRLMTPAGSQIVFAINRLAAQVTETDKYPALLTQVGELLQQPEAYENLWGAEWEKLQADLSLIDNGQVKLTEYPAIDLAVVETPRPLEPMAVYSRTERLRVLTIAGTGFYQLQYRYESWVQVVSRPVRPRIDLYPLAEHLQKLEAAPGHWRHEDITDITPELQFVDFEKHPTPSGLTREQVVSEVVAYFEREQDNAELQWEPYDQEETPTCGLLSLPDQPTTSIAPPALYNLKGRSSKDKED